jgi:hypothetical protein
MKPMVRIIDVKTNVIIDREMTDPEYLQYQADQTERKRKQKVEADEKAAKDAAKLSARTKLIALGLTADEISALGD